MAIYTPSQAEPDAKKSVINQIFAFLLSPHPPLSYSSHSSTLHIPGKESDDHPGPSAANPTWKRNISVEDTTERR